MSRIGESDCEALRDGLIAQPINTLSSLAFGAVGLWLLLRGWRRPPGSRLYTMVFGASFVLVGLGSVAFHGPQVSGSRWLHDWSIATAVAFVAAYDLAVARRWPAKTMMPIYLGTITGVGIVLAAAPDSSEPIVGALAAAVVASEVYVHRAVELPRPDPTSRVLYGTAAVAFVAALVLNFLGRTGAPWCDPESLAQGHAAWHVLASLAAAAFAVPFLERDRSVAAARQEP